MAALTEVALVVLADRPPVLVLGEPIAPGLAIIPAVDADGRYRGGWLLAHESSGRVLTAVPTCVHCARLAAAKVTGIDWTRSALELTSDQAVRDAVTAGHELTAVLRGCSSAYTCEIPEGC